MDLEGSINQLMNCFKEKCWKFSNEIFRWLQVKQCYSKIDGKSLYWFLMNQTENILKEIKYFVMNYFSNIFEYN